MAHRSAVPLTSADFPADPYPGARPDHSFVQDAADAVLPLDPVAWTVAGLPLDDWLRERGEPTLRDRRPVLAYGSNVCPQKIEWLRTAHGLAGAVVVVRARCRDVAAVWASGFRTVDDQRPATLAAWPGADELHAVWFAAEDQIVALDGCEGRREGRYDLAELRSGSVTLEGGEQVDVLAYVGSDAPRMPMVVDGAMVRCADVPQREALLLRGAAATSDGLDLVRLTA